LDVREATLALECLLFVANEPLPVAKLRELMGIDGDLFEAAVAALRDDLTDRSLQVVEVAGGYRMMTRPQFARYVEALFEPHPERVSRSGLEVLAIIAYRQPITRPEIDAVRGVNSVGAVLSLLRKGLIKEIGRREAPGRPILYATTPQFLEVTGLRDLSDLPKVDVEIPDARVLGLPTAVEDETCELPLGLEEAAAPHKGSAIREPDGDLDIPDDAQAESA